MTHCGETRFIGHLDFDLDLDLVQTRQNCTVLADDIAALTVVSMAKAEVQDQIHV